MNRPAIRSILVVGDGIVGLSAALAFARALPAVAVSILRSTPGADAVADHFPSTLPSAGRFHAAIGFDELDLVARGVASHHLGTRISNGADGDWVHSFGEVGRDEGAVPFHQMWLSARQSASALAFDRYSPASVIGRACKFVHPSGDSASPLGSYLYGLRLNPSRYRALLEQATKDLPRYDGELRSLDRRADGLVAAACLDDGRRIEADWYIDCTGPTALLMDRTESEFEDWSSTVPATHLMAKWRGETRLDPLEQLVRIDSGWRLSSSVRGATLDATLTTSPVPGSVPTRPGRQRNSFVGNVLAIGGSAVSLDPLHASNLSLAHSAILRAIALVPGRDFHPLELAEYNRLTRLETDRARDFHALFQMPISAPVEPSRTLDRTLAQWRARGRLPFFEEETFTPSSWAQLLIGTGHLPDHVAATARGIDRAAAAKAMASFADEIQALADRLPNYADYIATMSRARSDAGHG